MQHRNPHIIVVITIIACTFYSCKQIRKSFEDTLRDPDTKKTTTVKERSKESIAVSSHEHQVDDDNEQAKAPEPVNFLADSAALAQAQNALQNLSQFKGKGLKFFQSVHFYDDGRIMVQLQDPNQPDHIDEYTFKDEEWGDPEPVQLSGSSNLENSLMPVAKLHFSAVAKIYNYLNEKSKTVEDAVPVSHIYFVSSPVFKISKWYASLTGARERYSLRADINGDNISLKRD